MRWTLTVVLSTVALTMGLWDTPWMAYRGAIPAHVFLMGLTFVSLFFDDTFAREVRKLVSAAFVILACVSVGYGIRSMYAPDPWVTLSYLVGLVVITWSCWFVVKSADQLTSAVIVSAACGTQLGVIVKQVLEDSANARGLALLISGAACLAVGSMISGLKVFHRRNAPLDTQTD